MKLKPLGDRLIVRAIEEEETTASGIVLPDTAKEKPQKGKVLAVGDGRMNEETGKRTPLDVAEGDEVLYSKYGGTEIIVDGEDLLFSVPHRCDHGRTPEPHLVEAHTGCIGDGVWGSPTVDPADGSIYVSFLNTTDLTTGRDDYEVVKVDPTTGAPLEAPVNGQDRSS